MGHGIPVASLRLFAWKLALLTHRFEIPDSQDIEFVQIVAAPALAWGLVDFGILFPLAVIGLARVPRARFWWFLSLATLLGLVGDRPFLCRGPIPRSMGPGIGLARRGGGRRPRALAQAWRVG